MMDNNLAEIRDLSVSFDTYGGSVKAVRGVSFGAVAHATQSSVERVFTHGALGVVLPCK